MPPSTSAPALLGGDDDPSDFEPAHPVIADAHRRHAGLRIPKTGRVFEALVPAILEQKVITLQATASWRHLVRRFGSVGSRSDAATHDSWCRRRGPGR